MSWLTTGCFCHGLVSDNGLGCVFARLAMGLVALRTGWVFAQVAMG
jgi:hypothetical protein